MKFIQGLLLITIFFSHFALTAELQFVTNESPPTNFLKSGEPSGTTTDIVLALQQKMGIESEIEFMPWARAYKLAFNFPNVFIFTAGRTKARIDHGFHFIGPVITRKHTLWKKRGSPIKITDVSDIVKQDLVIGGIRGDWRSKYFAKEGARMNLTSYYNQNLNLLMRGRVDLWIASDISAPSHVKNSGYKMEDIEVAMVFKQSPSYIMISKDTPTEVVKAWKQGYQELLLSSHSFEKLSKKWSRQLGLDLKFTADKGFHVE
ncbi:substrate-binding periplasmic protein [Dongshaea marina]|uniref:substrate-binding periplasmic protein n=1 Tax=Dongshaea marina TaxID=2047966 RepID=UPI000D3E5F7E|nr:transporter substrate-binding domain-containing protein [Dongshaea marina]